MKSFKMINVCSMCSIRYETASKLKLFCDKCRKIRNKELWKKNRIKNKEKRTQQYKDWLLRGSNKEGVALRMKSYNTEYKQNHREQRKTYRNAKLNTDENYKKEQELRSRLHKFLKSPKENRFSFLVGCTKKQFVKWLEQNFTTKMNWNNYGTYWSMDHVIPLRAFDLTNQVHQTICFNWKNTRPLICTKNSSRKLNVEDILFQELKSCLFSRQNSDIDSIEYGISYLPSQVRNCLMDLVNC